MPKSNNRLKLKFKRNSCTICDYRLDGMDEKRSLSIMERHMKLKHNIDIKIDNNNFINGSRININYGKSSQIKHNNKLFLDLEEYLKSKFKYPIYNLNISKTNDGMILIKVEHVTKSLVVNLKESLIEIINTKFHVIKKKIQEELIEKLIQKKINDMSDLQLII